ncbi:MAG: UvrD-helicase domain-containing protein [Planctomycetota bacterium]
MTTEGHPPTLDTPGLDPSPLADPPSPLLEGLTDPQRDAVTHVDGPLLVLAGPGSGKTRVITHRVAFLVRECGVAPWNVLAITFTNKAAAEMRERLHGLLTDRQAKALQVSTFHALCAKLIRLYADRLGLPPGYSIYDTADQKAAVKQALTDLEINTKNFPPAQVLSRISDAKNKLVGPDEYARAASDFYARTVAKAYTKYTDILQRNGALDFDDLLMKTVELCKHHPDVLAELQQRYQYVLVDEYQDTNHAQFMIASAIAAAHKNIMATGDPDQSIYGWRGADLNNILDFEAHYPDATLVRLEQNYRSTKAILHAADTLIQNNTQRKHKSLWTDNHPGEPIDVATLTDEHAEAQHVVDTFRKRHEEDNVPWAGMAVFYRINSLSRVAEDAFRNAGIPYQIARGTAFYDRKEIKDAVGYLRAIANPSDEVTLFRIINNPARGISKKTTDALQAYALAHNTPMDALLADPTQVDALNPRAQTAVQRFNQLLTAWRQIAGLSDTGPDATNEVSLRAFVERVLRESGLEAHYRNDKADPDSERLANLMELVSAAQQFEDELTLDVAIDAIEEQAIAQVDQEQEPPDHNDPDHGNLSTDTALRPSSFVLRPSPPPPPSDLPPRLSLTDKLLAFLERIALVADVDAVESDAGAVTLMTLHAAKGLEFDTVALVGFEDGLLPHDRANTDPNELEEERRLAFVGITRAMRRLLITHANVRTVFGTASATIPSRFLKELPDDDDTVRTHRLDDHHDAQADWERSDRSGHAAFGRTMSKRQLAAMRGESPNTGRAQRAAAQGQAAQYPPGTLVRHPKFGLGRVQQTAPMGAQTRCLIEFNTAGRKTLILQYARLEIVTDHDMAGGNNDTVINDGPTFVPDDGLPF